MKNMVQIKIIHVFSGDHVDARIPIFVEIIKGFQLLFLLRVEIGEVVANKIQVSFLLKIERML